MSCFKGIQTCASRKYALAVVAECRQDQCRRACEFEFVQIHLRCVWCLHALLEQSHRVVLLLTRVSHFARAAHMNARERQLVRTIIKQVHPDVLARKPVEQAHNTEALKVVVRRAVLLRAPEKKAI